MKNSYILLRNNTESTPLYAEDLQRMGLKSTDLIWVECQSVCWQSPQEIPELRNLLTAQANQVAATTLPIPDMVETDTKVSKPVPITKKSVFVEMPVPEKTVSTNNSITHSSISDFQKYAGVQTDEPVVTTNKVNSIPVAATADDSEPFDEIHDLYMKKLVQGGKNLFSSTLSPQVRKIILYTGLVVSGALLMWLIKKPATQKPMTVQPVPTTQTETEPVNNSLVLSDTLSEAEVGAEPEINTPGSTPESYETGHLSFSEKEVAEPLARKTSPAAPAKPLTVKTPAIKQEEQPVQKETISAGTDKMEKDIKTASDIKPVKPVSNVVVASQLNLTANDYNVGSFGGIRNLQLTLQNDSRFLLDKVTVEIQYLNPEGIVLKTETIYFQDLPPGEKATMAVAKTKRGVKVSYKIIKIESKEVGSAFTKTSGRENEAK